MEGLHQFIPGAAPPRLSVWRRPDLLALGLLGAGAAVYLAACLLLVTAFASLIALAATVLLRPADFLRLASSKTRLVSSQIMRVLSA